LAYLYRHTHGAWLYVRRHPAIRNDLPIRLTEELPVFGPLSWTDKPGPWRQAQGDPVVLYAERTAPGEATPYDLKRLEGIDVGNPWLSDRVDDSFWAMKQRIVDETGHDFLTQLSDAWRAVSFDSDRSQYTSWHKAGRAIDTLLDYLSPDHRERWLEVVLERGGGETYWRLYLKCRAQDGSQGMPLKVRPWDATAAARRNGRGGQRKPMPNGYYVDLTDLMAQYGWLRIASHDKPDFHWHSSFMAMEYWHFQKTEDLPWYDAMLELFPADLMEVHHRWEVQKLKGMPPWLAQVKGIPLPWAERRILEMIAP
jgi:TolB protein